MRSRAEKNVLTKRGASRGLLVGLLVLLGCLAAVPAGAKNRPVKATPAEIRLAGDLQERLAQVQAREEEVARRQLQLEELQQEVDGKLAALTVLQQEVKVKLDELKAIKDQRFKKLVSIYGNMSASKLAPLLDKMEDRTVADILRAMKPDSVASVLPKMDRDKAVRVSRIMGLLQ